MKYDIDNDQLCMFITNVIIIHYIIIVCTLQSRPLKVKDDLQHGRLAFCEYESELPRPKMRLGD